MISLKPARAELPSVAAGAMEKICFVPLKRSISTRLSLHLSIPYDDHTSKGFDLFSNNVNATVVTSIEFKHHLPHILRAIYPPGESENG
jgi:hypothetical protein